MSDYFTDPNLNRLYVEVVKEAVKQIGAPVRKTIVETLSSLKGYGKYIEETHRKVSSFRSLVNPNQSVSTAEHYIPASFKQAGDEKIALDQCDLLESLRFTKRYVISGYAGYGKSMAMRHLALSLFENPLGRIPIFVELRALNRLGSPNLIAYMHSTYAQGGAVDSRNFEKGLENGIFLLLLDGFDEVSHEIRQTVEGQILSLSTKYPRLSILVSGRPNENRYSSWKDFEILKLLPMNKIQTISLIEKLDHDIGVKKRFIAKLKSGLFESHQSFLSTPLLAILMLLTFQKNANIPDKMYLFYGKAYETLYNQHDAMKDQYDRPKKSGLQIDEFQQFFATFCFITYVKEQTEFTQVELVSMIRESLRYASINSDVEDVLYDLQESICLMVNEGNSYFFIHRSFQEYFTAVFLSTCAESERDKFLDKVSVRHWDQVLSMLYDMASEQIESTWLRERLTDYFKRVGGSAGQMPPYLARYGTVWASKTDARISMWHLGWGEFGRLLSTVRRLLPDVDETGGRVTGAPLNAYLEAHWDELAHETEEIFESQDGRVVERQVAISQFPLEVLQETRMIEQAEADHAALRKAWRRIERQRLSKESFIDSLIAE